MLATFAFDVCHDVYLAAREVIDSKIPTMNADAVGEISVAAGPDAAAGGVCLRFRAGGGTGAGGRTQRRKSHKQTG